MTPYGLGGWDCDKIVCDLVYHHKATVYTSLFKRAPIQVSKHFCDTESLPVIAITLDSSDTIDQIMSEQMIVFMNISQLLIVLIP